MKDLMDAALAFVLFGAMVGGLFGIALWSVIIAFCVKVFINEKRQGASV